ncbi:hypothetical protein GCM10009530_56050 [Microbispora corallina]|uniref:MFS transporter n=1 Tax=Microbispora corallina TaxID=83302 RepID=A0ABQ4G932_9ACTN|nr:hypothetical protein [Microbispora corallina]GIH43573.1 hypothetical protein Mco01_65730 [Microbispora corallina]
MHGFRRDLGLLRDRRFALLLTARTVSVLGASFAPVALAFGVLGLPGATAATLSAVLTAEALPWSRSCWSAASSRTACPGTGS